MDYLTDKQWEDWLCRVARERLANRPELLIRFLSTTNLLVCMERMRFIKEITRAEAPFFGGPNYERAQRNLVSIVDGFAKDRMVQPIPSLPAAKSETIKIGPVISRAALVAECANDWPTLEADLSNASKNGLGEAARAESKRGWHKESALEWARTKGKLTRRKNSINSVFDLGKRTVHRLE